LAQEDELNRQRANEGEGEDVVEEGEERGHGWLATD
jgi:hypothetical protein